MGDQEPASAAPVAEPSALNVRLLEEEEEKGVVAARIAARNLAQNIRDESSAYSRTRQAKFIISSSKLQLR